MSVGGAGSVCYGGGLGRLAGKHPPTLMVLWGGDKRQPPALHEEELCPSGVGHFVPRLRLREVRLPI